MAHEHETNVVNSAWHHPAGACAGDCSPGAFPGAAAGDLVHEDMRVQGCAADPGTFVHYGVRRWDTVSPDGEQTTHPPNFIMETTDTVEWTLPEARKFLYGALMLITQAELAEWDRLRRR